MDQQSRPNESNQPIESQPLPQNSPPTPQQAEGQKPLTAEQARSELKQAIRGSNEVLSSATTALVIFSDTLTLDRAKLTLTKRAFWKTAEVMSIRIEDILNVTATVGPIFGSVKVTSRIFNTDKPYTIEHFWREDALRIKRITQGYVIALQRGIDCSALPTTELASMLDKLGEDTHS
jgi:hypothetical protein